MSDQGVLVQRARRGDKDAFVALMQTIEKSVYHLVIAMVENRHDAEDVWQETVIKAWLNLRSLRSADGLRAWVCRIALNEARNLLRRRARQPMPVEELPEAGLSYGQNVEECLVVHGYLQSLPPEQRSTLVMRFWLDMTLPEIAQAMGVPLSTAKSRLYLGMERMKSIVGKEAQQVADSSN